jgi:hypothetical protein
VPSSPVYPEGLHPGSELDTELFSEPEFSGSDFPDSDYSTGEFSEASEQTLYSTEEEYSEEESSGEESSAPTTPLRRTPQLSGVAAALNRRRRRRVDPLQRRREQLRRGELQRQALLPIAGALREGSAPLEPSSLAPATPPSAGRLGRWNSRRPGIPSGPGNRGSALQRQLARPLVPHLLEEQRRRQAAAGRLGRWLAGVEPASRELQQRQWQQWFRQRGLTLELTPEGSGALGTPEKGTLALDWLEPLLGRLLRRQRNLLRLDRRRLRRRRRLKRRSRRRRRIKARRRRFWRLTHRRR